MTKNSPVAQATDCYLARRLNPALERESFRDALQRAAARRKNNPALVRSYIVTAAVMIMLLAGGMIAAAVFLIGDKWGWILVGSSILWSVFLFWIFWIHLGLVRSPDGSMRKSFGIPNTLTFFRLLMVPMMVHYLSLHYTWGPLQVWGLFIILAAGLTDSLDGALARLLDWKTDFGKFSDPMADVVTTSGAAVAMTLSGVVPAWLSGLIVFRYVGAFLGFMLTFMRGGNFYFKPTIAGKVCTPAAQTAFFLLFLGRAEPSWALAEPFPQALVYIVAVVVGVNTLYLFYVWYRLSRRKKQERNLEETAGERIKSD